MSQLAIKHMPCVALLTVIGFSDLIPTASAEPGDWIIRAGISAMETDSSSGRISTISNSGIELDDATSLSVTAVYFLSDVTAIELTSGLPHQHDLRGNDRLNALGIDTIAEIKSVPTTLGMQFYWPNKTMVRPYAGLGATYTVFFDEEMKMGGLDLSMEESLGISAVLGMDMALQQKVRLNLDVRYIDMETTAKFEGAIAEDIDLDVDPLVYTVGLGYRF